MCTDSCADITPVSGCLPTTHTAKHKTICELTHYSSLVGPLVFLKHNVRRGKVGRVGGKRSISRCITCGHRKCGGEGLGEG